MTDSGFVKVYRSILNWEWYGDIITTRVFLHLLLTVNFNDSRFQGVEVPTGSRVCSIESLAQETGLSFKQIRGSLDKLERAGTTARQRYAHFSIISIKNWDSFQSKGNQKGNQKAISEASKGQHNKNIKNKEDNLDTHNRVSKYGEYNNVLLSDEDIEKLKTEFPADYIELIERLSSYMASTGKSYKNHLATIRNWARKENSKQAIPKNQKKASEYDTFMSELQSMYEKEL